MKIRLTVLTENDTPTPDGLTEEKVKAVWQTVLNLLCLTADVGDKAIVEKAEFVEDGDGE